MARPILIKERNGRGGHRYAVVHSGELTVEERRARAEGRLQVCLVLPDDLARLPLDRLVSAYERARMERCGR